MYFNVITFKNTKTLAFTSPLPYSAEKAASEWSVVTDEKTGQILSFRGSEITAIIVKKIDENDKPKGKKKKPAISTSVTTE